MEIYLRSLSLKNQNSKWSSHKLEQTSTNAFPSVTIRECKDIDGFLQMHGCKGVDQSLSQCWEAFDRVARENTKPRDTTQPCKSSLARVLSQTCDDSVSSRATSTPRAISLEAVAGSQTRLLFAHQGRENARLGGSCIGKTLELEGQRVAHVTMASTIATLAT